MHSSTQKRTLAFVARDPATKVAALRELAPLALGITHRWLGGADREALKAGFAEGAFQVAYVPAHDADPRLLTPEELVDEVRLNEAVVHQLLGAAAPERRVVILGRPVGPRSVAALEAYGVDAIVLPRAPDEPCRVGERLILATGVTLLEEPDGQAGEGRLDERLRELTPPWLPRVDFGTDAPQGAGVAEVLGWLADSLGFARVPRVQPAALFAHALDELPPRVKVPLLLRLARAADGEGWARRLLDVLCIEVELGAQPQPQGELAAWAHNALPDPSLYEALAKNGWRGRDRWLQLYRGLRYGELRDNCMMRSMAIL